MFQDSMKKLDPKEIKPVLVEISPHIEGGSFDPDQTTILVSELSFYPGYNLLDIADYTTMPELRRVAVYRPGDTHIIDYTHDGVYALNKKAGIYLDQNTAADYIRFFFYHVRGKHGKFSLIENVDDILWREDPPPQARKLISEMILPVEVDHIDDQGNFIFNLTILFKNSLLKSRVLLQPDGRIEMGQEQIVLEDIPVQDDILN